jgi:hypothetical protein
MPARLDLTGQQFGRLTAVKAVGVNKNKHAVWECECACGNTVQTTTGKLRTGNTRSCGCLRREAYKTAPLTHGMTGTPEYRSWAAMKNRCTNPNNKDFRHYGGRGIKLDRRWENFANFLADMGARPPSSSLERINNEGNYEPGNVKWSTTHEQSRNRRNNQWLDTPKGSFLLTEAAAEYGIKLTTLRKRLQAGWPVEKALTTPVRKRA